jgi:hypothetical protein
MKKMFCLSVILIFGVGCQIPVPSNVASFGNAKFSFPKDIEIEGLEVTGKGTNFSLKATKWKSKNNPDVIMQSAEGQAKIIEATGNVAATVAGKVMEGAVKGAK